MGLAASQARLLSLVARKSDLELSGQFINQSRMQLASMTSQLFSVSASYDPNTVEAKTVQARIERLQQVDKMLEMRLKQVDTQHQAVQTELDAVQKVISKNIEGSFKTFG